MKQAAKRIAPGAYQALRDSLLAVAGTLDPATGGPPLDLSDEKNHRRTVYGAGEVTKKARLLDPPAAAYPDTARAAKAKGEVRLRMVLASDGMVKYIFPMKPLKYGLTEAAMEAAQKIKFEPAIRDGKSASQFATLSYEFKNGRGRPPYFPAHEFYF